MDSHGTWAGFYKRTHTVGQLLRSQHPLSPSDRIREKVQCGASMSLTLPQHSVTSPSNTQEERAASSGASAKNEAQLEFSNTAVSSVYFCLQSLSLLAGNSWCSTYTSVQSFCFKLFSGKRTIERKK